MTRRPAIRCFFPIIMVYIHMITPSWSNLKIQSLLYIEGIQKSCYHITVFQAANYVNHAMMQNSNLHMSPQITYSCLLAQWLYKQFISFARDLLLNHITLSLRPESLYTLHFSRAFLGFYSWAHSSRDYLLLFTNNSWLCENFYIWNTLVGANMPYLHPIVDIFTSSCGS